MVLVDGQGLPLGVHLSSASPGEASLAEATLAQRVTRKLPKRIIADKGYDWRALWERFRRRGIDLIAPHLRTRKHRFQDGRKLRRYKRRWIIERTNAWLFNFRRLTVRYEHSIDRFKAFLQLACALIALRQF
jgi:transposase